MHQPMDQDGVASAGSTPAADDWLELSAVVFDREFHFCTQPHGDWRDALRESVCDSVAYEVSLLGIDDLQFDGDRRLLEQLHTGDRPRDVNALLASLRARAGYPINIEPGQGADHPGASEGHS